MGAGSYHKDKKKSGMGMDNMFSSMMKKSKGKKMKKAKGKKKK